MRSSSDDVAAESAFREALAIASQQGALAWELRAATSLGRLLARCGRQAEARQMLAGVYDRFSEGFETPTLTEARGLLAEFS